MHPQLTGLTAKVSNPSLSPAKILNDQKPMQHIRNLVGDEFAAVNELIIEQLHSRVALVENIGEHLIHAGGKRLRPLLVLLAGRACELLDERHIQFATIIEFLHTATLLHDDVVDVSNLRRGLPTANAKWGNAPSVLVGDFIYSRAFQILAMMGDLRILNLLAKTTNLIAEGEVLQLTKAGQPNTSAEEYMDVIEHKTAILFAAATRGAAILSGADDTTEVALGKYGLHLGLAFQLIDDLLDYTGDPAETGKNIGDDLAEGKPTLPLIYTISHGSETQSRLVCDAIRDKSARDLDAIIAAVQACGALEHTREQARLQSEAAIKQLAVLPANAYRQAMQELTDLALQRSS